MMTLEEVNYKIKEKEKELEELRKIRQEIKNQVNLDAEKKRFIMEVSNAVDNCRGEYTFDEFYDIGERIIKYYFDWRPVYMKGIQQNGKMTRNLNRIWNDWKSAVIKSVTNGRVFGLKDKTGNLHVTMEEIYEIRRKLNEKTDKFCSLWVA